VYAEYVTLHDYSGAARRVMKARASEPARGTTDVEAAAKTVRPGSLSGKNGRVESGNITGATGGSAS